MTGLPGVGGAPGPGAITSVSVAAVRSGRARRGRVRAWRRYNPFTFYLFVAPWLVGFVLLTLVPLGYALWLSFTNFDAVSPRWRYVGVANYAKAVQDPLTWQSLTRSFLFTGVTVPLAIALGLLLAVLVDQKVRWRGVFRALFYLPVTVPPVAAAITFRTLFDRDAGAVNGLADAVGGEPQEWLLDPHVFVVIVLFVLWGVGANMVISLAGLQGIPPDLLDASKVDGAGAWRSFRHVTLPLLSPVLFFQAVTGVIASIQTFVPALLLSNPETGAAGVPDGLRLFMVHVFSEAFQLGQLGYASALLWLLFVALLAFTVVFFKASSRAIFYTRSPGDRED